MQVLFYIYITTYKNYLLKIDLCILYKYITNQLEVNNMYTNRIPLDLPEDTEEDPFDY